ncbi:HupE/UreJ family protein [Kushneria sp. TE3]|uniref:HupE/UreJ family protein n=1 Tax=Kushneria sp. TE3 TaxID=3449832 RepID=UPI003F685A58
MRSSLPLLLATTLMTLSLPAMAHPGHEHGSGLVAGLLHPLTGADHLLAMIAVGLWAGFVMPQRVLIAPLTFMTAMAGGALLGWAGVSMALVEPGILLSVVVFGLLTLTGGQRQSAGVTLASLACIGVFAVLHGHAHATEASGHVGPYLMGFMLATAALHGIGVLIALAVAGSRGRRWVQRTSGVAIAAGGVLLMAGAV